MHLPYASSHCATICDLSEPLCDRLFVYFFTQIKSHLEAHVTVDQMKSDGLKIVSAITPVTPTKWPTVFSIFVPLVRLIFLKRLKFSDQTNYNQVLVTAQILDFCHQTINSLIC